MSRVKVLLVDDQTLFIDSLRTVLQSRAKDIEVVGVASNGREAIELTAEKQPDVILMDIRMANMNGVECTRIIKEKYPSIRVLMLTTIDEDEFIVEALRIGAAGYLLKDISASELIAAVRAVYEGGVMISPKIAAKLVGNCNDPIRNNGITPDWLNELSERERQILSLMVQGFDNKEIAKQLYLGEQTVRNYASLVYNKMGVSDRIHAIRMALEAGLHEPANINI